MSLEEQGKNKALGYVNDSAIVVNVGGRKKKSCQWLKIGIPFVVLLSFTGWLTGWLREQAMDATSILAVAAPMQKQAETLYKRNTYGKKLVALTFDDGPYPATTSRLLDVLREKEVRATFFELGTMASRYPETTRRVYEEKHELASHTMSHRQLNKIDASEVMAEIGQAKDILKNITGVEPKLMRPPYGSINYIVREQAGVPMILWTVDTEDWKSKDAAMILERAKATVFDGAVILMHDIYESSVDGAGMIIDELRKDNYEFVTVSELAEMRGVELKNGEAYGSFRP